MQNMICCRETTTAVLAHQNLSNQQAADPLSSGHGACAAYQPSPADTAQHLDRAVLWSDQYLDQCRAGAGNAGQWWEPGLTDGTWRESVPVCRLVEGLRRPRLCSRSRSRGQSESTSLAGVGVGVGVVKVLQTPTPSGMCWREDGLRLWHIDFCWVPAPMAISITVLLPLIFFILPSLNISTLTLAPLGSG